MRIVCAGMKRSGSTWLYNVARLVCVAHGKTKGCFEDVFAHDPDLATLVVKTHRFNEAFLFGADRVLTSRRDPRDVAASAVRRGLCRPGPVEVVRFLTKTIVDEYAHWRRYSHLDVAYEEMIADRPAAVEAVAAAIGVSADAREISAMVEALPVGGPADPEILLHRDHFTDGRVGTYDRTLRPETVGAVEAVFGQWMEDNGYQPQTT